MSKEVFRTRRADGMNVPAKRNIYINDYKISFPLKKHDNFGELDRGA